MTMDFHVKCIFVDILLVFGMTFVSNHLTRWRIVKWNLQNPHGPECRTGVIQYVVPHVPPLLRSFPILIVKHHEQQDVEVRNSK